MESILLVLIPKLIFSVLLIFLLVTTSIKASADESVTPEPTGLLLCNSAGTAMTDLDMSSCTGAMAIPSGSSGQRPSGGWPGMVRYNTTSSSVEMYAGGLWNQIFPGPMIPIQQAFEGTTQRLNPIMINKTAAVAGGAGNAVFNMTSDGTSTGSALCPNGVMLNSPNLSVNDATAPYQFSWAWSNSNKTMTVLTEKASGLAVLTFTLLGLPAPVANGTSVNSTIICY